MKTKFTRTDIQELCHSTGLNSRAAQLLTDQIITAMAAALAAGNVIELRGLGTLEIRERKARAAHNPRTLQAVQVPARRVVFFKPSGKLRQAPMKINTGVTPEDLRGLFGDSVATAARPASGESWGVIHAIPRDFSTGTVGYFAVGKIVNPENPLARYQFNANIMLIGSKPKPEK